MAVNCPLNFVLFFSFLFFILYSFFIYPRLLFKQDAPAKRIPIEAFVRPDSSGSRHQGPSHAHMDVCAGVETCMPMRFSHNACAWSHVCVQHDTFHGLCIRIYRKRSVLAVLRPPDRQTAVVGLRAAFCRRTRRRHGHDRFEEGGGGNEREDTDCMGEGDYKQNIYNNNEKTKKQKTNKTIKQYINNI